MCVCVYSITRHLLQRRYSAYIDDSKALASLPMLYGPFPVCAVIFRRPHSQACHRIAFMPSTSLAAFNSLVVIIHHLKRCTVEHVKHVSVSSPRRALHPAVSAALLHQLQASGAQNALAAALLGIGKRESTGASFQLKFARRDGILYTEGAARLVKSDLLIGTTAAPSVDFQARPPATAAAAAPTTAAAITSAASTPSPAITACKGGGRGRDGMRYIMGGVCHRWWG